MGDGGIMAKSMVMAILVVLGFCIAAPFIAMLKALVLLGKCLAIVAGVLCFKALW